MQEQTVTRQNSEWTVIFLVFSKTISLARHNNHDFNYYTLDCNRMIQI